MAVRGEFYQDGVAAEFAYSSEASPLESITTRAKTQLNNPHIPSQEQLAEQCRSIRADVKAGKSGNIEIRLNQGRQLSDRVDFLLGNTAVKVLPWDADKSEFIFIKAGDTLDTIIFIGGEKSWAIMLLKDENGHDFFLRLAEFHMLSIQEKTDPRQETGLMSSYSWLTGKVFTSTIISANLDPVKNLLVSSWLEQEWQRAKEAKEHSSNELKGGDANGQGNQKEGRHSED